MRINFRKMNFRPHKITPFLTIALGLGGYFLGIPAMVAGVMLGYFISCVLDQVKSDKEVYRYLENPGPSSFNEAEPGLAAFCALGVYLLSKASPKVLTDEAAAARVTGGAISVFPQGKKISALADSFCRLAQDSLTILNPDLLTESLFARRKEKQDRALLGSELASMAIGKEAQQEALYIRQFLDPGYEPPDPEDDPWAVLGISKGASYDEVKSTFRKLAIMFHPDNQTGLDEEEQKKIGETFIKIRDAYHTITRGIMGDKS